MTVSTTRQLAADAIGTALLLATVVGSGIMAAELADGLTPETGELVMVKQYASAFFGTSLASTLSALSVDTLILTGCSTSGCVRATAVDGMQHGLRVVVPKECVGDRHPGPHDAALFDIQSKYGDVVPKAVVMDYLASQQGGLS